VIVIGEQGINIASAVAVHGGDVDGAVGGGEGDGDVGDGGGAVEVVGDGNARQCFHAGVVSGPIGIGGRAVGVVEKKVGGKIALRQIRNVQRAEGSVVGLDRQTNCAGKA